MSVEAMSQVWKLALPRDQKFVLLAFADHADDYGRCYPSLARIAWKSGYEQSRSVSQIVGRLIEAGVLEVLEDARGRMPTLYRIRWDRGALLPEFDPKAFKASASRGAKNAPHEAGADPVESDPSKSLTEQGESQAKGAENAPQGDRVRKTHPDDSVGVRSDPRRGAFFDRRGAVATAPEPLTNNQRRAGARASQSRAHSAQEDPGPPPDPELLKLNNSARILGIEPKTPNEPMAHFQQRIAAAHQAKLDRMAAKQRERAAAVSEGTAV